MATKRRRKNQTGGSAGAASLADVLQRVMGAARLENLSRLATLVGMPSGTVYASGRGDRRQVSAYVAARLLDPLGVNIAWVMLGPAPGRPFFVAPPLQHLDPSCAEHAGDVAKALCDAVARLETRAGGKA